MQLFIMRHGEADVFAASDQKRELTAEGRVESLSMAPIIMQQIIQNEQIPANTIHAIVSPYVRAQQTWQILKAEFEKQFTIVEQTTDHFTPNGHSELCMDYLQEFSAQEHPSNLFVVSHLPLVNYLTLDLLQKNRLARFSTATVVALEVDFDTDDSAQLLWMKSPHQS